MTLSRRLAAEALGTALLLAVVVGSGIMGERLAAGNAAIALLANEGIAGRKNIRTLDAVAQFTHIARPQMIEQCPLGAGRQYLRRSGILLKTRRARAI